MRSPDFIRERAKDLRRTMTHLEQIDRDRRRTAWLEKEGIRVVRFSAQEIEVRPAAVLAAIARVSPRSTD